MPVQLASKTSNQDSIDARRQKLEAARAKLEAERAERDNVLGPHLELLERMKSLLPPDSPDHLAILGLFHLVNMTPVEQAKSSVLRTQWEIRRKPFVLAEMRAMSAA
jgi:hypothetical protein